MRALRQRRARLLRAPRTLARAPSGVRTWLPRALRTRRAGRQQGLLARRRRAQNGVILLLFLAVQAIVWLIWPDPWVRGAAAVVGVLAVPVLVTLALDRRPHS